VTGSARLRTFLAAAVLALVVLLPAAAQQQGHAKYGGTLVVGLTGGDPESLDPTVSRGSAISIYPAFCQRLFKLGRNHGRLGLVPELAASLPVLSKDKLSYTVALRKDVLFNDGTPFNAQAVVTTVERYMTYPLSSRATDYASVASVSAAGPYTVVFKLKARNSAFFTTTAFMLSPAALEKQGASFAANPVCAGPFMFDHRVVGDNVTLVKSPHWYDRANVHLDKIVYRPMTNGAAAAAALRAGDIQVLDQMESSELPAIQKDSSLKVLTSPQLGWRGILINIGNRNGVGNLPYSNVGTPLASSPLLRQAFEQAIDRATMNRVVFNGLYQTTCTPIPPANTAWFDAIKAPCTPYDPADAKRLVARSGYSNPTVRLLTNTTADFQKLAQFIQAQEAAVGINVVIDSTDSATVLARQTSGNFDVTLSGLQPGNIEPAAMIQQFFSSTSGVRNYSGYANPRVDFVLDNGLKATTLGARAVNYRVAQQVIHTDRPAIFLYNITTLAAHSTSLGGVQLSPNGGVLVHNAWFK
jgi:peptide/nickel transport system substrate-binding protein